MIRHLIQTACCYIEHLLWLLHCNYKTNVPLPVYYSYCRTNSPDGVGSWRSTPAALCSCILLSSGASSLTMSVSLDLMPTASSDEDGRYERISLGGKPIKTYNTYTHSKEAKGSRQLTIPQSMCIVNSLSSPIPTGVHCTA